jgi:hypothetical protein
MTMTKKQLAPLRTIVNERNDEHGRIIEILECGHEQPQKQDIYGPTNALRRRCRRCLREGVE